VFVESTISVVLFSLTVLALIGPYLVSLGKRVLSPRAPERRGRG